MIRAILFDFNGVLVDDEPIHLELFQRVFGEEGIELTSERYYRELLGFDDRDCFRAVLRSVGEEATVQRVAGLIDRKARYYRERIEEGGVPFFPGAAELVGGAIEAGLMLGVVSGALRWEVESALLQANLLAGFKILVTAEDVTAGKPSPQGYVRGLEGMNVLPPLPERIVHPHEVIAIEDSPAGLQAARDASLVTVAVGHTYERELLSGADLIVDRIRELDLERLMRLPLS